MKKKIVFFAVGIGIVLVALAVTLTLLISNRSKTVTCGFYDVPEEYQKPIKTLVEECGIKSIKFTQLSEKDVSSPKLGEKLDILFAFNDANTSVYADHAVPLTKKVAERIPGAMRNSSYFANSEGVPVVMPVVLDNFETSVLTTVYIKHNIAWPSSLEDLNEYCLRAKNYYPAPIIISGELDVNVLSYFTEMVISFGGKEAYESIKKQLADCDDFMNLPEFVLPDDQGNMIRLKEVFEFFKDLQRKGYVISNWNRLSQKASNDLIDDNRISAILMNLSENRTKTMPNMYYYSVSIFPVKTQFKELSVQPVLGAVAFKKSEAARNILEKLSTPESQELLSVETRLGPAMLQGTPCDMQADDARYIAASTQYGPVPDLGTAALKTKEERHQLAEAIRAIFE